MKRGKFLKYVPLVLLFIAIGTAGMIIEHFEGESFIVETVTQDESAVQHDTVTSGIKSDGRLNINTASADELIMLDGIGEKTAQKIIEYRAEHGNFGVIEELSAVKGISLEMVSKMADKICVE